MELQEDPVLFTVVTSGSPGIALSCKQGSSEQHHYLEQLQFLLAAAVVLFSGYGTYQFKWGGRGEKKWNYMPLMLVISIQCQTFLCIKIHQLILGSFWTPFALSQHKREAEGKTHTSIFWFTEYFHLVRQIHLAWEFVPNDPLLWQSRYLKCDLCRQHSLSYSTDLRVYFTSAATAIFLLQPSKKTPLKWLCIVPVFSEHFMAC